MALQGTGAELARGIVELSLDDCSDGDSSDDNDKQVQQCSRTCKLIERGFQYYISGGRRNARLSSDDDAESVEEENLPNNEANNRCFRLFVCSECLIAHRRKSSVRGSTTSSVGSRVEVLCSKSQLSIHHRRCVSVAGLLFRG